MVACPWLGAVVVVVVVFALGVLRAASGPVKRELVRSIPVGLLFRVPQTRSCMGLTATPTTPSILSSAKLPPVVLANAKGRWLLVADGSLQQGPWQYVQAKTAQGVAEPIFCAYALIESTIRKCHWT